MKHFLFSKLESILVWIKSLGSKPNHIFLHEHPMVMVLEPDLHSAGTPINFHEILEGRLKIWNGGYELSFADFPPLRARMHCSVFPLYKHTVAGRSYFSCVSGVIWFCSTPQTFCMCKNPRDVATFRFCENSSRNPLLTTFFSAVLSWVMILFQEFLNFGKN